MPQPKKRELPRLLQLIRDNAEQSKKIEVRQQDDGATADIYLYDVIDSFWGVSAADFVQALNGITAPTINLHINSPGGDVFEARAMATAIKGHTSTVNAFIDGIAASAATYVALAADKVQMADGAFFMIHQSWVLAVGNANDLMDMAALLEKVDASIANDYAKKSGQSLAQIEKWMADETWFTAQEALDNKFIDAVFDGESVANEWQLSAYAKTPAALIKKPEDTNVDQALNAMRADKLNRLKLYERT